MDCTKVLAAPQSRIGGHCRQPEDEVTSTVTNGEQTLSSQHAPIAVSACAIHPINLQIVEDVYDVVNGRER